MSDEFIFGCQKPDVSYSERQAAYVVITKNARFAAVKPQQKYFLPGGGFLPGETAEDTIFREVSEELACGVRLLYKIGAAIQYFYSGADDRHYKMRATFFAAEFTGESSENAENKLCWVSKTIAKQKFFHECHFWAICQA